MLFLRPYRWIFLAIRKSNWCGGSDFFNLTDSWINMTSKYSDFCLQPSGYRRNTFNSSEIDHLLRLQSARGFLRAKNQLSDYLKSYRFIQLMARQLIAIFPKQSNSNICYLLETESKSTAIRNNAISNHNLSDLDNFVSVVSAIYQIQLIGH
ncbi:unnamed protein product [Ambrosiozyma monospora]|uniref:Unnamed protein product n=1 Tax=Ambrosiozyma monospora TaxID=43982 RepID=A0ACB5U7N1_AMBMO|nr:unnamed protein product [Ambrosiozyma monospora]